MRLPKSMRRPGPILEGWWIVVVTGMHLMVLLIFVTIGLRWWELGLVVDRTDLPRRQFNSQLSGTAWPARVLTLDAGGALWIVRSRPLDCAEQPDPERLTADRVDAWLADRPAPERGHDWALLVRSHRDAPWSVLRDLLNRAARAGETIVHVGLFSFDEMRIVFADGLEIPRTRYAAWLVEDVVVRAAPPARAADVRERVFELGGEDGESYLPVVRLELGGSPTVEDVVRTLECYAVRIGYQHDWWPGGGGVFVAGIG